MTEEDFQEFVTRVDWVFAKSIPNWPHFYIVEEELDDPVAYAAARSFIRDEGYDGHFFDLKVRYHDLGEWSYWSSPLAKPFEEQYMINRCRTEYTWDALSKAGELPPEGFEGNGLSLAPVLEDPDFRSLLNDGHGNEVAKQREIGQRYRKVFHALPYVLGEDYVRNQCSGKELEQLKAVLTVQEEFAGPINDT